MDPRAIRTRAAFAGLGAMLAGFGVVAVIAAQDPGTGDDDSRRLLVAVGVLAMLGGALCGFVAARRLPGRWALGGIAAGLAVVGVAIVCGAVAPDKTADFTQTFLNTLSLGSLYALIALGYTLVYGVLRFINFAHSDIVTWSAWIAATVAGAIGWSTTGSPVFALPIVLVVTMVVCAAMGVAIEIAAYRPLRNAPRLNVLITAIGVSLLLQNLGILDKEVAGVDVFFGTRPIPMPPLVADEALATIGGVRISREDVLIIGLTAALMVGMQWLVFRTRMGRAMRAVSFDERTAALMGINVNRVISVTFAIGSALAAAGGVLYGLKYDTLRQTADAGWVLLGLKAFVAAVVGGIGNVRGAVAGALLIAFVEIFATRYLPLLASDPHTQLMLTQLRDVYVFGLLILVLLFKPSGLFGKAVTEKV